MVLKELLFKELVRRGYSKRSSGEKVWDVSNRSFLYMTTELTNAFLEMWAHPRYRATVIQAEIDLLKANSGKIINGLSDEAYNLIDLGCGNGTKAGVFLESLRGKGKFRYCPVSPSEQLTEIASKKVRSFEFNNVVDYKPYVASLESLSEVLSVMKTPKYPKSMILILGSILAGFDIHEYLFNISRAMLAGCNLIIGNGIRVGARFQGLANYQHPLFEKWLSHIIRELGFENSEVSYGARFENGRVEIFYKIKNNKKLNFDSHKFEFKKGDEIVVAILYKYYAKELEEYCKMYFREVELVKDKDEEYALIFCKK